MNFTGETEKGHFNKGKNIVWNTQRDEIRMTKICEAKTKFVDLYKDYAYS